MHNSLKASLKRNALVIALIPLIVLMGCPSQSQLASLTEILGSSAANVAQLEGNSSLATKLQTDTAAAVAAVKNWKSGTPANEAIEALNIVSSDLKLILNQPGIPADAPQYAPLITLAIGAAQGILAILQPASTTTQPAVRSATVTAPAPKTAPEFKKQWNAIVAANPPLSAAKLN